MPEPPPATPPATYPRGIPNFTVRWTEPEGHLSKTQHSVEVNVKTPNENRPLSGEITAESAGFLGPIPAGGLRSDTHMVKTDQDLAVARNLWNAVRGSAVQKWLTHEDTPGAKLDRNDMELVIRRGADSYDVYRADLKRPAAPVQDVIDAASKVIGDMRVGPRAATT
jgi:hypothetical protein